MKNDRLIQIRGAESQPEFAKRLGVHRNTVARYENGTREPDGGYLRRLAHLGWSPMWVLTGLGDEKLSPNALPGAATDTALVVARNDPDAEARRDETIKALGKGFDQKAMAQALTMVEEALDGRMLAPAARAELIGLVYELVIAPGELPTATITQLVRAAARGNAGNARQEDNQDSRDPGGRSGAKGG
ncbi:MAG: helix-turn-helix transcriptional regulator [Dokdonella sp.]